MEISDNSKSMPLLSAVENDIRHEDEVIFSMPSEDINNVNPKTRKFYKKLQQSRRKKSGDAL